VWRVFLIGVAILVALFLFGLRPTPILGVDGKSLEFSIRGSGDSQPPCRHGSTETWICTVDGGSINSRLTLRIPYRVEVNWLGCWKARRIGRPRLFGNPPLHLSGCVTLGDHIRPFDNFFRIGSDGD
jgi:hypothetical protein